jgi:hypothetical protein
MLHRLLLPPSSVWWILFILFIATRNFIICTHPLISLGKSSQGEWGRQGMRHAWERREKCTRFWWEIPKERDHSEDQGVCGKMGSNGSWGDWLRRCGVDSTGSGQGPVAGCCECGDETSGSCATELVHRPDDGGSNHFRNVGHFLLDYTVQHPRRHVCCELCVNL